MNVKTAAQAIRDVVTMDEVIGLYGYRTKNGFLCCPFHGEKQPSLKIYGRTGGWHCYGCGRGGSVIDFVMEHEQCSFPTAVRAIDRALHLGLMDPHEEPGKARDEQRIQKALDDFVDAVYAYCDVLIRKIEHEQKTALDMVRILEEKRDGDIRDLTVSDWTEILKWKDDDEYNEDRKARIREFREVVAEWRRKARRAT